MAKTTTQDIADAFCKSDKFERDLVYVEDYKSFYIYTDNRYYQKIDGVAFRKMVLRFCMGNFGGQDFSSSRINDIINLIQLLCSRSVEVEDSNYIVFNDTLLNTNTFETEVFNPQVIATHYLPYNFDEINSSTPNFIRFLETSLVDKEDHSKPDDELINLVQEMMGYYLTNNSKATGAFFLYGVGANGKSQLSKVIEKIVGERYVSSLGLGNLADRFGPVNLINKKINISNEEDERYASSRIFKALVTGDRIHAEYKFGESIDFKPTCKFLFSTNKLPTFDGLDYGLKRRIFIIPFYRRFKPEEQDKSLFEKLEKEIPGIIGWALKGARRLAENNYVFSNSKASALVFKEFEEEMSAALHFFNENYLIDNNWHTPKAEIYESYSDWVRLNGKKGVYSRRRFFKELEDNIEGLVESRVYIDNKQSRSLNCRYSPRDNRDDISPQNLYAQW